MLFEGFNYHALWLLHINLVSKNDKGEVVGVPGARLDQKLVPPAVEGLKALDVVHIEHQYTAIGTTVECHTEGLEALLTSSVPNLSKQVVAGGKLSN